VELRAGHQTQLAERGAGALIGAERLGLLAAPVQRQHEEGPTALAERLLRHQVVEKCQPLAVPAAGQLGLGQLLGDAPTLLLQPCCLPSPRLPRAEVDECLAPPESERGCQRVRRRFPLAVLCRRPTLGDEALEATAVHCVGSVQHVPGGSGLDRVWAQHLAQPQHEVLDHLCVRPRWIIAPDRVDEPIGADDLAFPGREQREHGSLVAPRDRQCAVRTGDLERSENSVLERARIVALAPATPSETTVRPAKDRSR
jgi:hypothetical protein